MRTKAVRHRALIAASFSASTLAVLYLPYFLPVKPSTSQSYIFGYNNAAGAALLIGLGFLLALWLRDSIQVSSIEGPSPRVPAKVLWFVLAVMGCVCADFYWISGRFVTPWEGSYILNRVYLLSLGKRPYIDFEFPWGPAFLYPARFLGEVLHLPVLQSYAAIWWLGSVGSLALLYAAINLIDVPARHRTTIFVLFSVASLLSVGNMGLNYTLLRYTTPLVFILLVDRARRWGRVLGGVVAVVCSGILLLISPEVAISHMFACAVILWPRRGHRRPAGLMIYCGTLTVLGLLIMVGLRFHVLDSLFLDGGGANGLPIAIGPANLTYFAAVFFGLHYGVRQWTGRVQESNVLGIIAFSIPMAMAALGRCDPAHILLNGMGFFLVALVYASSTVRWWPVCRNLFIAFPLGMCALITALTTAIGLSISTVDVFPSDGNLASLYAMLGENSINPRFEIPFSYQPNAKGYTVSDQIDYGFFYGDADANTPWAIERKVDELRQNPANGLLLRADFATRCEIEGSKERLLVSVLSGFPYLASVEHPKSLRAPLCTYIKTHYRLAEPASKRNFEYGLWLPLR